SKSESAGFAVAHIESVRVDGGKVRCFRVRIAFVPVSFLVTDGGRRGACPSWSTASTNWTVVTNAPRCLRSDASSPTYRRARAGDHRSGCTSGAALRILLAADLQWTKGLAPVLAIGVAVGMLARCAHLLSALPMTFPTVCDSTGSFTARVSRQPADCGQV